MRILVTGANGFVGQALCRRLVNSGHVVRGAVRNASRVATLDPQTEPCIVGDVGAQTDWCDAVRDVEVVIHLVAGLSAVSSPDVSLLERCRAVNVAGTRLLAKAAAKSSVRHFIFISTIKVNGESTPADRPYLEADFPHPQDAYAASKWEAEQMLWEQGAATNLPVTVLRPPIIYGPGVGGNVLALMRILLRGVPLPLASIHNQRSLIYVENLVDAIVACMESPVAANRSYLVSDGDDVSTPELIRQLAAALGVGPRLLACPAALLKLGATLLGKQEIWRRLGGSLSVDISRIRSDLGWQPPYSLREGLEKTAARYLQEIAHKR